MVGHRLRRWPNIKPAPGAHSFCMSDLLIIRPRYVVMQRKCKWVVQSRLRSFLQSCLLTVCFTCRCRSIAGITLVTEQWACSIPATRSGNVILFRIHGKHPCFASDPLFLSFAWQGTTHFCAVCRNVWQNIRQQWRINSSESYDAKQTEEYCHSRLVGLISFIFNSVLYHDDVLVGQADTLSWSSPRDKSDCLWLFYNAEWC